MTKARPSPHLNAWALALLQFCVALGSLPFGLGGFVLHTAGRSVVAWACLGVVFATGFTVWITRLSAPTWGTSLVGGAWALALGVLFLTGAGMSLHLWLDTLRVSEYPITPSWALAALTLSAVAYGARTGLENLLRLAFPMALIEMAIWMVELPVTWGLGDTGHLSGGFHFLGAGGHVPAAWPLLLFAAHGGILLPVFGRYVDEDLRRPVLITTALASLLLGAAFVLPVVVWNFPSALRMEFPLLHSLTPVSTIFFPVHRLALLAFIPLEVNLIVELTAYVLGAMEVMNVPNFPLGSGPAVLFCCMAIGVMGVWPAPTFELARLAALWSLSALILFAILPWVGPRVRVQKTRMAT